MAVTVRPWLPTRVPPGARSGGVSSVERLSSGKRVNRAADDAAGLGVATNLETAARSTRMALRNARGALDVIEIAESGTREIEDQLQRLRTLAVQAASETLDADERAYIAEEAATIIGSVDATARSTTWGSEFLLLGSGIDVAFVMNTSLSMSPEIGALLAAVSTFEADLSAAGLDVQFALSEINASVDPLDGSRRVADFGEDVQAALSSLGTRFGLQDAYAALLEAAGVEAIPGAVDPDALGFRPGARERHIILFSDDPRDLDFLSSPDTAADVGQRLADAGFIVHAIIDTAQAALYQPIVDATGGTLSNAGNVGQFIGSALQAIGDDVVTRIGPDEPMSAQVGIGSAADDRISLALPVNLSVAGLGIRGVDLTTPEDARAALDTLDTALDRVNAARAELGAAANRVSSAAAHAEAQEEALRSAESTILDADFAEESAEATAAALLRDAGLAALGQARRLQASTVTALLG